MRGSGQHWYRGRCDRWRIQAVVQAVVQVQTALTPSSGTLMESKARFLGHSVHQMLIVFPLGLLATSVIFDIIQLVSHDGKWSAVAFYMIISGVIGGLVAAIFGLIDYLSIPSGTRAKHIAGLHGAGNVVVLLLFATSWYFRLPNPADPALIALTLSFLGFALAGVTGWLGGELVDRLGMGVDEGANLNAPSSLSHRHAQQAQAAPHER